MPRPVSVYSMPPFAPDPSTILAGKATSSGGTIITIPAGMTWVGNVAVSASVVSFSGPAITASARVSTAGAGVIPAAGDYLQIDMICPQSLALLNGTSANDSNTMQLTVIAPNDNAVTLKLNTTNTTTQSASAFGVLCQ